MPRVISPFNDALLERAVVSFEELLVSTCADDTTWKKTAEGIRRHGLLSVAVPVERKSNLPEIDVDRLHHDRRYRQQIARQLLKPVGPDHQRCYIPLERHRLGDPEYLRKLSGILGYRWAQKIAGDVTDLVVRLSLLQLDAQSLGECLHRLNLAESNAENVSRRIMLRMADEEMDRDPATQELFRQVDAICDEVEARALERLDVAFASINADTELRFARIAERTQLRFDALQARIAAGHLNS